MIPKKDNPSATDYWSITCPNTINKLITSVIDSLLQSHGEKYRLMQINQWGRKAKTMFCVNNLLIYKMVRDSHFQKKNLQLVGVKKAFDSVFHQWIIRTWTKDAWDT